MATSVPDLITQEAQAQGVDPDFALAIAHQESGFNQGARSPKGAMGVMQLMPATAKDLGVDPTNAKDNIKGGVKYLAQLGARYNGDPALVAAAYNAGPAAVDRFGGVPPYAETQNYVNRVTGIHQAFSSAGPSSAPTADDLAEMDRIINGGSSQSPNNAALTAAVLKSSPADTPGLASAPPKAAAPPPSIEEIEAQSKAQGYKPPPPINQTEGQAQKPESQLQQAADQNSAGEGPVKRGLLNAANGPLFGAEPFVRGMMAGSATAIDNLVHGKLLLSPSDIGGPNDPGAVARATTQAEQKANNAYYQQHPVSALATGLGGALAGGGLVVGAEKGVANLAAKAVPGALDSAAARLALGAGTTAAAYGGQSGLETAEGGGSLGQIAAATGAGALSGAALHGIGAAVRPVAKMVPTTAGRVLTGAGLGAAGGATLGAITGQPVLETALAGVGGAAGGALGERIGDRSGGVVSPKLEESLLAKIPDADVAKLDAAPDGALAAEALGQKGEKFVAQRAGEDPELPDKIQAALDVRNEQAPDRAAAAITKATGIDPSTASADIQDQIEANKRGPLKAAYDAALPGNPVWSDDLAEQFQRPEVRKAYNAAKIEMQNLGEKPELPNPNYQPPAPVARSNTGAAIIDPQVHQAWMAEGTNDPARLLQMQADHTLATAPASSRQPQMIPTDRTLDLTKRNLDTNYNVTNPSERRTAAIMGTSFRNAIDPLIPGYADARAQWGDTASYGDAYQYGRDLFKSGAKQQPATAVAERLNNETPANIQAIKHGIAAVLHEGLTNAQDMTPKLTTPRMQAILKTAFGDQQASDIVHAVKQQAYLKKSGAKLVAKATPKDTSGNHSVLEGAVIGAADSGLHPLRMIEHIAGGSGTALAAKSIAPRLAKGFTTKPERAIMADLATMDAREAAARIKAAKAKAPPPSNLRDLSRLGVLSLAAPVSNQISGSLADY